LTLPGCEIKELKQIANRIGFTSSEAKVVLFLCAVILAGLVIKYIINLDETSELTAVNYSEEDSLFNYYRNAPDSLDGTSNLGDKKVDYEQELLDFSENDLSSPKSADDPLTGDKININTADSKTLSRLPGIGIKTAEKIIALRSSKQRFDSVEELLEVKGIGEAKLNNIRKHIIIE
jgi:competence ComEA-like helix-hairpin-helix protein